MINLYEIIEKRKFGAAAIAAIGLVVLYGGLAALIFHFAGSEQSLEVGGIAALGTAALCLVEAPFVVYLAKSGPDEPLNSSGKVAVTVFCVILLVLVLPLIFLTLGRAWRWAFGEDDSPETASDKEWFL